MNEARRSVPRAPVGSLVLIALMYLPWLRYFIGPHSTPAGDGGMDFPGAIILLVFAAAYLITAIVLPIRLYRRRNISRLHAIAFYASLGIIALCTTFIWRAI